MTMDKESILKNYKFAILFADNNKMWICAKDEAEIERIKENEEINDGDIVLRLTPETLRVAVEKNFIELK